MKTTLFIITFFLSTFYLCAQIDEYSVFGLPTGTTAQILAVTPLSEGALVYSTDEDVLYRYTSSGWVRVGLQNALEVSITDVGGNFTGNTVEAALQELATATAENIYTADGTLTANRAVTQNNFDLNFDANTLVISGDDDRVGIRTASPSYSLDVRGNASGNDGLRVSNVGTGNPQLRWDDGGSTHIAMTQIKSWTSGSRLGFALWDGTENVLNMRNGSIGVGTENPSGKLEINETTGTAATASTGSLVLSHDDSGGTSSIVFKSAVNANSDAGYIQFSDDGSGNGSSTENGLLEIGTTNDGVGTFQDDIALMPSGNLGVNTNTPTAKMDVNGDVRVRTLPAAADTDQLVSADSDGNLRKVNSLKASKIFYPPSIAIDASTNGTFTVDLYAQYVAQYGTPAIASAGAPAAIPTYGATDLYYYVTYADPDVFGNGTSVQNMSIDANGVLSYEIFNQPADYNALINVVFVVK